RRAMKPAMTSSTIAMSVIECPRCSPPCKSGSRPLFGGRERLVQIEIELKHIDPGFAKDPEAAGRSVAVDERCNLILRHAASIRHALDLQFGIRGGDFRV